MGDIDLNQFETQQAYGVANEAVAEQANAENIASKLRNSNVRIMNKREWTNEEKLTLV